jgi:hypothetical protein
MVTRLIISSGSKQPQTATEAKMILFYQVNLQK